MSIEREGSTKSYLVFAGSCYYPYGGMNDLIGVTPTILRAKVLVDEFLEKEREEVICFDHWWQIYDVEDKQVIKKSERQPWA